MFGQFLPALRMLAVLTVLTASCIVFGDGIAQIAFPHAANAA